MAVNKYIKRMGLSFLFIISITKTSYSQTKESLSDEVKKSVSNAFLSLDGSLKKKNYCFLMKIMVDDHYAINDIEISDSVDSLFKKAFLGNLNLKVVQNQRKNNDSPLKIILVPVYILSIDKPKLEMIQLIKFYQFKNEMLIGQVYIMPTCIIKTKFSQN